MADSHDSCSNENDFGADAALTMVGSESDCSYLPGRVARMEYRLAASLTASRYEQLLARGWRRFGRTLFRPACRACRECQSLRVIIDRFRPSKSQRRCRNRNSSIRIEVTSLRVTDEHVSLYNRYHLDMSRRRGWPFRKITASDYYESFLDGQFPFSREFQYWVDDRLVGIGIVDMTDAVMSSIYFIHDPEFRETGLGTFSVMAEIEQGRQTGQRRLYMGYYIRDCGSMNYKNRFRPHEILQEYVGDRTEPVWDEA